MNKFGSTLVKIVFRVQEIKFGFLFIIFLSVVALQEVQAGDLNPNPVIASVNNFKFYKSDIEHARKRLPREAQQYSDAAIYEHLRKNLIDTHLLISAARKEGFDKRTEIVNKVRRFEDRVLHQAYLDNQITGLLIEERLKERYLIYLKSSSSTEEIRARHILLQTREQAIEVIRELKSGKDFENLARKISTDPSAKLGGDLGYFTREQMVSSFSDVAFSTSIGQFTSEPVKTEFGWHIIKVEDKRSLKPKSFEQMKTLLREKIINEHLNSVISKLRKSAKIKVFGPDGK